LGQCTGSGQVLRLDGIGGRVMNRTFTIFAVLLLSGSAASAQHIKITKGSYLAASGQWKSDAEALKPEEAPPKVLIECDKNINLCAVAQGPNLSGDGNLFTRLDVSKVHYTILHWDQAGMVAQTSDRDCVKAKLVIDFRSKSVTMIETPKGGDEDNEFCKVFTKTVTSHLVDSAT
jgi:hypothetical protein